MSVRTVVLVISVLTLTGCSNSGVQNYEIIHQPNVNSYTYKSEAGIGKNVVSGANLAAPKYMKHRRPQRRFIHGAFK